MRRDNLSYFTLMGTLSEKRKILNSWISQSSVMGPSLCDYIESTKSGTFGGSKIILGDRKKFEKDCHEYIERLIRQLDKCFKPSVLQESLSVLFDPQYLIKNMNKLNSNDYGRSQLNFLRKKCKMFPGFDSNAVIHEWESLKQCMIEFINYSSSASVASLFWRKFIVLKQEIYNNFIHQYKHLLILLNIYLIAPTNSAECERGV